MPARSTSRRARIWVLASLAAAAVPTTANAPLTRAEADRFVQKLTTIQRNSEVPARRPRITPVGEREVNAYFRFHAGDQIPPGVVDPTITIVGPGRLAGEAVVDLDAVRKVRSSGGWLDPYSYLAGRLPVRAEGILHTRSGVGRLEIQAVEIGGVPVSTTMLQELVSYYSRTPEQPRGVRLDDPFELPAKIREIQIGNKEALIVQ